MKTFRLIGMALITVLMCVNFTSCNSDDDEEPIKNDDGVITNQKRLTRIEMVEDGSEIIIWEFTYDSKGRLSSANQTETYDGETDRCITNYSWGNNVIMSKRNYESNYDSNGKDYGNDTYFLQDNLIKSIQSQGKYDDYEMSFSYNSSKQLTNVQSKYSGNGYSHTSTDTYTWENGKIIKRTNEEDNYKETYEYTYSGKTCKGYFPLYSSYDELSGAHPELIGMRCSQLPDQIYCKNKYNVEEEIKKYTYTFDKDGYVESCTVVETDKSLSDDTTDTETTIYTFKWE